MLGNCFISQTATGDFTDWHFLEFYIGLSFSLSRLTMRVGTEKNDKS